MEGAPKSEPDNIESVENQADWRELKKQAIVHAQEMIDAIKESNDDTTWKTEYLAQFVPATQGSVFKFSDANIYNQQELLDKLKETKHKSIYKAL